ncbi:MAG: hypothetical protein VX916_07425 [Planctomycetota bacterium]|nr:hypothetical protein [Planctomycetota bacterium]
MTLISGETLQRALPWSAVLEADPPHNRFIGDQARIYYPYLQEAKKIYAGEENPLWTTHGGGGQPFLGNMSSSLFHPLTALVAVLPVALVPLIQGLLVLVGSAWFTFLFLRRLGVRPWPSALGAVAFGFGGHQVFWLQYALSHVLVALPACFWATERLVQDRCRSRVIVLALCFSGLIFGGHPETALVSGVVAVLWAFMRMWDGHGRTLVAGALLLSLALTAVQWVPFLEYVFSGSHGLFLRQLETEHSELPVSLAAGLVFSFFLFMALLCLRAGADRGLLKRIAAVTAGMIALVMARRMGMAVSAGVLVMPDLYGSPLGGGSFSGAQDYPGLNAGFVGSLPLFLLSAGALVGLGGNLVRFFAVGSLLLWGTAFQMPAIEAVVRSVPGFSEVAVTRLLGPVGFMVACGAAIVLDIITTKAVKPGIIAAIGRVSVNLAMIFVVSQLILGMPVSPHGGREIIQGVDLSPQPDLSCEWHPFDSKMSHRLPATDGVRSIDFSFELDQDVEELRVTVDRRALITPAPHRATVGGSPVVVRYDAPRAEEGRHRILVEVDVGGETKVIADQPLVIHRRRNVSTRDGLMLLSSIVVFGWLIRRSRVSGGLVAVVLVGADVLSLGEGYNTSTPTDRLFPPTETVDFLQSKLPEGPFRIFTEGTILPPDTPFAVGLDHIMSYDNIGYHRLWQWLHHVGVQVDHFATFSFSRDTVNYAHPGFDVLDVRYVLTDRATDLSDIENMRLVHESETRVWENEDNLGRAFVVGEAMVLGRDDPEALAQADLSRVALLESDPEDGFGAAPKSLLLGGTGVVESLRHHGNVIHVTVNNDGPCLLVLTENRAPGWVASVDGGDEKETLHCDVTWQAVPVPAGRHEVEFRYQPPYWGISKWTSIVAGLYCLLGFVFSRRMS